jgi:SAM-dependent methyltransferase
MEPCIICGDTSRVRKLEQAGDYAILFCDACRLRFSHPMAHPGRGFYEDSGLYENRDLGNVSLSLPSLEWRYVRFLREARPDRGGRLLDVGCGDGGFLSLAKKRGLETFGLEIDSRGVAIARKVRGLRNVERGRLEDIEALGWKDFDLVTCMEVMEHVSDPLGLCRSLRGLIRPGGTVGISVPSWDRRPAWFGRETDYPPHHFTLWTKEALAAILTRAGFTDVRVFESPMIFQIFVYDLLSRLRARREQADAGEAPGKRASEAQAERKRSEAREGESARRLGPDDLEPRVNRARVAVKGALYAGFNLVNPLLRLAPGLRGFTLLAVARKPV